MRFCCVIERKVIAVYIYTAQILSYSKVTEVLEYVDLSTFVTRLIGFKSPAQSVMYKLREGIGTDTDDSVTTRSDRYILYRLFSLVEEDEKSRLTIR